MSRVERDCSTVKRLRAQPALQQLWPATLPLPSAEICERAVSSSDSMDNIWRSKPVKATKRSNALEKGRETALRAWRTWSSVRHGAPARCNAIWTSETTGHLPTTSKMFLRRPVLLIRTIGHHPSARSAVAERRGGRVARMASAGLISLPQCAAQVTSSVMACQARNHHSVASHMRPSPVLTIWVISYAIVAQSYAALRPTHQASRRKGSSQCDPRLSRSSRVKKEVKATWHGRDFFNEQLEFSGVRALLLNGQEKGSNAYLFKSQLLGESI